MREIKVYIVMDVPMCLFWFLYGDNVSTAFRAEKGRLCYTHFVCCVILETFLEDI